MNNLEFYNATLKDTCNTTYTAPANELLWSMGQIKVQTIYQRQVQAICQTQWLQICTQVCTRVYEYNCKKVKQN